MQFINFSKIKTRKFKYAPGGVTVASFGPCEDDYMVMDIKDIFKDLMLKDIVVEEDDKFIQTAHSISA